jgi:anti-sigma regulatory factor (Ser/Thr protein kinase)
MNAIEHGGRELAVQHVVSTEAFVDEGRLVVTVNDCGQWDGDTTRSRRLDTRGRGLTLMYGLMDHVAIHRSRNGTQVVITHRLDREGLAR